MKLNKPFLFIDLVKLAPDCEEPDFGLYVLGPTNYNPVMVKGEDFMRFLVSGGKYRDIQLKVPNAIDAFGPIFTPELVARFCQLPNQDVFALSLDAASAQELLSTRVQCLASEPNNMLVSCEAYLNWKPDAFMGQREIPRSPYQNHPSYRATAERLRAKGIQPSGDQPDPRKGFLGIPVSICVHNGGSAVEALMRLQSEDPPVATIMLLLPRFDDVRRIDVGAEIEYRGAIVASILKTSDLMEEK